MGAAEATKLDEIFNEMERKIDLTFEAVTALTNGTNEYLQPNPGLSFCLEKVFFILKLLAIF